MLPNAVRGYLNVPGNPNIPCIVDGTGSAAVNPDFSAASGGAVIDNTGPATTGSVRRFDAVRLKGAHQPRGLSARRLLAEAGPGGELYLHPDDVPELTGSPGRCRQRHGREKIRRRPAASPAPLWGGARGGVPPPGARRVRWRRTRLIIPAASRPEVCQELVRERSRLAAAASLSRPSSVRSAESFSRKGRSGRALAGVAAIAI